MRREPREKQFNSPGLYTQWLTMRGARPLKYNAKFTGYIWWLSIVLTIAPFATDSNTGPNWLTLFYVITVALIAVILIVDLLFFMPNAFHEEIARGTLDPVFSTSYRTSRLLNDLGRWGSRLTLSHLVPTFVPLGIMLLSYTASGDPVLWIFLPAMLGIFALLNHSGLVSAMLPKHALKHRALLIFLIVAVSVGMILLSHALSHLVAHSIDSRRFGFYRNEIYLMCFAGLSMAMFFLASIPVYMTALRLLEMRRQGHLNSPSFASEIVAAPGPEQIVVESRAVRIIGDPAQFEGASLYLQWLIRRKAWPMRVDSRMMPWLWRIVWLSAILTFVGRDAFSYNSPFYFILIIVGIASSFIIGLYPIVSTIMDFAVYVPRSVHDDDSTSMMQFVFMAPISSFSIVKDLRTWAVKLNLQHLAPSAFLLAATFLSTFARTFSFSSTDFSEMMTYVAPILVLVFLMWAFLLGTGVAAAGLPWKATSTGLTLLAWIVPVLVAVFWGGSWIATRTWDLLWPGSHWDFAYSSSREPAWFMWHYVILLLIPAAFAHWISPWLMEQRRNGRWG